MSEGPLAGVKVIELTLWMLGPLAGAMLGDLGADVVKIENPRRPDSGRNLLSNAGFDMTLEDGRSLMFEAMNRNKRGMALDLSTEAGKAVLLELVRDADVVLENFRPGALDRLGVGYERLKEIHPKLIYASASGHGFAGPDAGRPALDPVGQARSGLMWTHGGPQDGPNWHSLALADSMGANMLAYGVVAALAARDRTGIGEKVEVSHMMGSIWLSYWAVAARQALNQTLWLCITPFDLPVVPEVQSTALTSPWPKPDRSGSAAPAMYRDSKGRLSRSSPAAPSTVTGRPPRSGCISARRRACGASVTSMAGRERRMVSCSQLPL